jgi:hypothetical protein
MEATQNAIFELFTEIYNIPFPKGISEKIDDLYIELVEYDAYIMGFASSYLTTKEPISQEINEGKGLNELINESIEKLMEMRSRKQKLDKLANLLKSIS